MRITDEEFPARPDGWLDQGGCGSLVTWVMFSFFGWLIGYVIGPIVARNNPFQEQVSPSLVASSLVEGVILGLAQWQCLRRWLPRSNSRWGWRGWTIATGVGWVIGLRVIDVASMSLRHLPLFGADSLAGWALAGAAGATILGVAQWLVLERSVERAGTWIPLTAVSGAVATVLFGSFRSWVGVIPDCIVRNKLCGTLIENAIGKLIIIISWGLGVTLSVGIFVILTGIAMVWLLKRGARSAVSASLK